MARTITAALALAVLVVAPGALAPPAAADPFPAGPSTIYVAQNSPTQLFAAVNTGDELEFNPVGPPSSYTYNALAYHEPSRYLYGINNAGNLLRLHSDGSVEVLANVGYSNAGAFSGALPNRLYTRTVNALRWYDVVTGTSGSAPLSAQFLPADFAWSGGYFWGMQFPTALDQPATMWRMGTDGTVRTFTVPGVVRSQFGDPATATAFGGAWTYGNGNLGFTNNSGGTVQIAVTDPGGTPQFSVVSFMDGPASGNNDAAASPGDPVDLSIVKDVDLDRAAPGDVLEYTITVGNETAEALSSGYTITDQLPANLALVEGSLPARCTLSGAPATGQSFSCAEGPLGAGETRTLVFQATVGATVPGGMTLTNTAQVLGNEEDLVSDNNADDASTLIGVARLALAKSVGYDDANDNGNPDVGEQLTWTFEVRNTGDYDATGVSIDDPTVTAVTPAEQDIPAGGSATFTATTAVTQAMVDSGELVNTATATGTVGGDPYRTTPSTATLQIRPFPSLQAVKSAQLDDSNGNGVADEGEVIDFTLTVTNTGNVTVSGVSAQDDMLPLTPGSVDLAPGQVQEFTGSYLVTAEDVEAGEVVNVAAATGTAPDGSSVPSEPSSTATETVREGITMVKSAEDPDQVIDTAGEVVSYRFVVTNTGNTTLEDVTIQDDSIDGGTLTPATASILPGQQVTFTATRTVTQAEIDEPLVVDGENRLTNTATATGTPFGGSPITSEPDTVLTPLVEHEPATSTEKTATLATDVNGNGKADVGDNIVYLLVVTNTGNVTITDVVVADDMFEGGTWDAGTLTPGASTSIAYNHVVTQEDVDAGSVDNVAVTTGNDPGGDPVPPSEDETSTPGGGDPLLHAVKSAVLDDANDNGFADSGETIAFSVRVWNHGQVTATDVSIDDPMAGEFTPAAADIAPGGSQIFTAVAPYVVTDGDVEAGGVNNTATATGTDPRDPGTPITSPPTSTETRTPAPELSILKQANLADANGNGLADVGETITYSFVVANNGNIAIGDISVEDPMVTGLQPAVFDLDPGRSITVTADPYLVTDADVLAGTVDNAATVTGTPIGGSPITPPPSTTTTTTVEAVTSYDSVKEATLEDTNENGFADVGEQITYVVVVTNTGTLTLRDVAVEDPMLGDMTPATQDIGPGESAGFTGAPYTVTQEDVDAGGVVNVATVTGTTPTGDPLDPQQPSVEVPTPEHRPGMSVVKESELDDTNANGVADEGETITYTVTITNIGNVTLTDVAPADPMVTGFTPASVELAPGAQRAFEAEPYTVTAEDVEAGVVSNTATGFGTPPGDDPIEGPPATVTVPTVDPGLLVAKVAELEDTNGNGVADAGERIVYSFEVVNTGNTVLEDVAVQDPRVTGIAPASATVAPGEVVTFTADPYLVTEADILAETIENTATASGRVPGGPVIETPPSTVTVPPAPVQASLEIEKSAELDDANSNGTADEGERILFSFVVTNTGNVTQTEVSVVDPMVTGLDPQVIAELLPGEQATVTADPYLVTAQDVAAGGVTNVASASGTGVDGSRTTSPEDSVRVEASDPAAPAPDPAPQPPQQQPLPVTGAQALQPAVTIAALLLLIGLTLVVMRRRTAV